MHVLHPQIEDWVHLHKLHPVGIVHVQGSSKFPRHVAVFGSLHAHIDFVEDENVNTLQPGQLRLGGFSSA